MNENTLTSSQWQLQDQMDATMHLNLARPVVWLIRFVITCGLCVAATLSYVAALSWSEGSQVRVNLPATAGGTDKQRDALVDVGGYRLHFRIVDGRSPTIVLESGGGADSSEWSSLQPQLARLTGLAVVSYDRAGFGESDLPSTPYNAYEEVASGARSACGWRAEPITRGGGRGHNIPGERPDIVIAAIQELIRKLHP